MTIINILFFLSGVVLTLFSLIVIGIVIAWKDFKRQSQYLQKYQDTLNGKVSKLKENK